MKNTAPVSKDQKFRKTKTALLVCLIASSLFLSVHVWFGEELWPEGYNSFVVMLKNSTAVKTLFEKNIYSMPKENLSTPQKLVLTNCSERSVYYNSDENFKPVTDAIKPFVAETLKSRESIKNKLIVDETEWYNVLRNDELLDTRSIYVDYYIASAPALFARMIGIKETWLSSDVSAVKEFIIAPGKDNEMLFYVRDFSNGTVYKYFVSYDKKDAIYKIIDEYTRGEGGGSFPFSFELNLYGSSAGIGSGVVQKVFLNPMITLSTGNERHAVLNAGNPVTGEKIPERLLPTFGFRQSARRHYTSADGVEYYVENYSVLKIYSNGLIEYTADDERLAPSLSDEPLSLYEVLNKAIEFSENVWSDCVDDPFNAIVTSNLLESADSSGAYSFTLDYYFNGIPVKVELSGDNFADMNHAVEISVKNGKIIKYRQLIRKYSESGESVTNSRSIEALDEIYKNLSASESETHIDDIFLSYIEDGSDSVKRPVWCAEISGGGLYKGES